MIKWESSSIIRESDFIPVLPVVTYPGTIHYFSYLAAPTVLTHDMVHVPTKAITDECRKVSRLFFFLLFKDDGGKDGSVLQDKIEFVHPIIRKSVTRRALP